MTTKSVGVKALKDNLSGYIREVKAGSRVLITDRNTVVAELRQPASDGYQYQTTTLMESWVAEGRLTPPRTAKRDVSPAAAAPAPPGTAAKLLDEDRAE